jgi:hypothetical protein
LIFQFSLKAQPNTSLFIAVRSRDYGKEPTVRPFMKYAIWIFKGLILLWLVLAAYLAFGYLVNMAHVSLNWCPLKLKRFRQGQLVPVVYGYPSPEMLQDAQSGKIVLGGGFPHIWAALCPFCKKTARFNSLSDDPAVPLNDKVLKALSQSERDTVRSYAANLLRSAPELSDEKISAIAVSPVDVWLGTHASGLHRFDRETARWANAWSHQESPIGYDIRSVRMKGALVVVKHRHYFDRPLLYEDYTDDRGKTWHRD